MKYEIDLGEDKTIEVPESVQDKIIKDYLSLKYHWVIGSGMFLIGLLIGIIE